MRKFALCAALVGLMAAPLFADPAPIRINANSAAVTLTPYEEGPRDIPGAVQLWDGMLTALGGGGTTGHWGWAPSHIATTGSYPSWYGFVGEDMHLANTVGGVGTFTNFHWVYFSTAMGPFSTTYFHSSLALWATHPNFSASTATVSIGTIIGGYIISSLPGATAGNPGGGWIITVNVPDFAVPVDVWMLMATDSSTLQYGLTAPNTPAPTGALTHPYIFSGDPLALTPVGSMFTLSAGYGPLMFAWALHVPEPATLLLLAGGVLALRRRK